MAIIPDKNPRALIAYYVSLFSLFPCLGLIPGLIALTLGIMGARAARRNPEIEGGGHAWFAIVLAGLMSLLWLAVIIFGIAAAVVSNMRK